VTLKSQRALETVFVQRGSVARSAANAPYSTPSVLRLHEFIWQKDGNNDLDHHSALSCGFFQFRRG
jgi:hypothetical protein